MTVRVFHENSHGQGSKEKEDNATECSGKDIKEALLQFLAEEEWLFASLCIVPPVYCHDYTLTNTERESIYSTIFQKSRIILSENITWNMNESSDAPYTESIIQLLMWN